MEGKFTFCPLCGARAEAAGRFCAGCGESLTRQAAAPVTAEGAAAVPNLETLQVPAASGVLATANGAYAAAPGLTPPPRVVDVATEPIVILPVAPPADAGSVTGGAVSARAAEVTPAGEAGMFQGSESQAGGRRSRMKTGLLCAVTAAGSAALVVVLTGVAEVW